MKLLREILGYLLGAVLFVGLMPAIMWIVSGMPALEHIGALRASATGVLMIGGLSMSIWTIIYMKRRGKGNPMDAFGHEVAPRTQHLMTDGPYRFNRNPMLSGTLLYLAGVVVWLWTWQALLVWMLFLGIMLIQVRSEEKRLEKDFGEEYQAYKSRTGRFWPQAINYYNYLSGRSLKIGRCSSAGWRFGLQPRLRLWAIYRELGYVPWRKPRQAKQSKDGIFRGTGEAIIPFLNDDAKRTFSHLFMRPGYMIRDYIRGQHERYLAPFTALLVFYSVFTLLMAVVQPGAVKSTFAEGMIKGLENQDFEVDLKFNEKSFLVDSTTLSDKSNQIINSLVSTAVQSVILTHLDLYPEKADTHWKESLAAVESDLRSKGIPLFLGNFFLLWIAMVWLLRKKHGVSVSGAAAASAYVLCQFCVFMFLALLVTFGKSAELGILVMGILLFIDYRQWLGIGNKQALKLTINTGLIYLLITILFYFLLSLVLIAMALLRA